MRPTSSHRPLPPIYSIAEVDKLLLYFLHGSLDGIHSKGHSIVGVKGCDRYSHGFRSQSLLERFTSEDVKLTIEAMAREPEPHPTYALLLMLKASRTTEDIARAMQWESCSKAEAWIISARDNFVERLLAHD